MWTFLGIGYGPGSLSPAYWNLIFFHFLIVVPSTTSYGIPISPPAHLPEPKSGWRPVPTPIVAMIASEFGATGSESTRRFQGLSAGNTAQPPSSARWAPPPRSSTADTIAAVLTAAGVTASPPTDAGSCAAALCARLRLSQLLQERVDPVEQQQVGSHPLPAVAEHQTCVVTVAVHHVVPGIGACAA